MFYVPCSINLHSMAYALCSGFLALHSILFTDSVTKCGAGSCRSSRTMNPAPEDLPVPVTERRIQAMIRHQQMTLRVQQAHLNRLQVAESWIPEEQRLKIENEYTMMRAIHWRRKSNKPMPAAWGKCPKPSLLTDSSISCPHVPTY